MFNGKEQLKLSLTDLQYKPQYASYLFNTLFSINKHISYEQREVYEEKNEKEKFKGHTYDFNQSVGKVCHRRVREIER